MSDRQRKEFQFTPNSESSAESSSEPYQPREATKKNKEKDDEDKRQPFLASIKHDITPPESPRVSKKQRHEGLESVDAQEAQEESVAVVEPMFQVTD